MDSQELEKLLSSLRSAPPQTLLSSSALHADPATVRLALEFLMDQGLNSEDRSRLLDFLKDQPDLSIFDNQMQYEGGGSASLVSFDSLLGWLRKRARMRSSQEAAKELAEYLAAKEIPCLQIVALGGIGVSESTQITDEISLVKPEDLPDCDAKESLMPQTGRPFLLSPVMTAALVRTVHEPKLHYPAGQPRALTAEIFPRSPSFEVLVDASRLLAVAADAAPVELAFWSMPAPSVPCAEQSTMTHFETTLSRFPITKELSNEDTMRAAELLRGFRALSQPLQNRLRTPMLRLSRAKRRRDLADAAAELGIALESIFLDENEHEEITYRLATRAARFLEEPAERKQTLRLFSALYSVRSSAVHRGRVDGQLTRRQRKGLPEELHQTEALLRYGYSAVARALGKIIDAQAWPDWDSVVLE